MREITEIEEIEMTDETGIDKEIEIDREEIDKGKKTKKKIQTKNKNYYQLKFPCLCPIKF